MDKRAVFFKTIPFAVFVLVGVTLLFLFLNSDASKEEKVALVVNGREVTEDEFDIYIEAVARDRVREGREDIFREEVREGAIERATRNVVARELLEEEGITVSKEETYNYLRHRAFAEPGVETIEEFLDREARKGYPEKENMLVAEIYVGFSKLAQKYYENTEVTDETIKNVYDSFREKLLEEGVEDADIPEFEEMKERAEEVYTRKKVSKKILDELEKRLEEAEVDILK